MDYRIQASEDGRYVIVTVEGDITCARMMECIKAAHGLGRELHTNLYLMDATRARNVDTPVSNYNFAHIDLKCAEAVDKSARVAAVVAADDDSHDFVATALNNGGMPLRLFRDRGAALEYLCRN